MKIKVNMKDKMQKKDSAINKNNPKNIYINNEFEIDHASLLALRYTLHYKKTRNKSNYTWNHSRGIYEQIDVHIVQ